MRTESEVREKLDFLIGQRANGNDPEATREIDRLKWVLHEGPDHIRVPMPRARKEGASE